MDALSMLIGRRSCAKLGGSGPTQVQIALMLQAATRAADHGNLQPWRFLLIEDTARAALGDVFVRAAEQQLAGGKLTEGQRARYAQMPLRAPCLLTVIARVTEHPKVPKIEQLLAVGAAAQNILNAAFALGVGAIWRTGDMAFDPYVKQALQVSANEEIVGFIYLGEPQVPVAEPKSADLKKILSHWQGN